MTDEAHVTSRRCWPTRATDIASVGGRHSAVPDVPVSRRSPCIAGRSRGVERTGASALRTELIGSGGSNFVGIAIPATSIEPGRSRMRVRARWSVEFLYLGRHASSESRILSWLTSTRISIPMLCLLVGFEPTNLKTAIQPLQRESHQPFDLYRLASNHLGDFAT